MILAFVSKGTSTGSLPTVERDLAFGIIAGSLKGEGRARRPQQKAEGVRGLVGTMHI